MSFIVFPHLPSIPINSHQFPIHSHPIPIHPSQGTELQQRLAIHVQMGRRGRVPREDSGPIFGEDEAAGSTGRSAGSAGAGQQRGELGDHELGGAGQKEMGRSFLEYP